MQAVAENSVLNDPTLKRQVETIRNLVECYIKIVTQTTRDMVPKIIVHTIINDLSNFMYSELLLNIYATEDQVLRTKAMLIFIQYSIFQNVLMEESMEEAKKREEKLALYHTCKEALKVIGDLSFASIPNTPEPKINRSVNGSGKIIKKYYCYFT